MMMLLLLIITGCMGVERGSLASASVVASLSGAADAGFARAYTPIDFVFPRDHGPHPEYRTEWWYYTGNLADSAGNQYGYQLTFFRSALTPELPPRRSDLATNQVYMAHFALTDVAADQHQSFERYSRGAGGLAGATDKPSYSVWLEDWSVRASSTGTVQLQASAPTDAGAVALALTLRETRPPVLHGDHGLSQKGPEAGNASYYYSLVHLETTGTITTENRTIAVTGLSWMDHEFGTSALSANAMGWDWFSIQLDSGAILMLARVRTADGGVVPEFEGTYVAADGAQSHFTANDFTLTVLDEWRSPRTQITYPSGWQLTLPDLDITLTIEPLLQDQEVEVSFVYWEGAVQIQGMVHEQPVQGVGYVELTGYGQQTDTYQR